MKRNTVKVGREVSLLVVIGAALILSSCSLGFFGKRTDSSEVFKTTGGVSGILASESLSKQNADSARPRNASLIGIRVAEYLSHVVMTPVRGALEGVRVHSVIAKTLSSQEEDYTLLQQLENVISVNVSEMLNRSTDRRAELDSYLTSLGDIGKSAEERRQALTAIEKEKEEALRAAQKQKNAIVKELKQAIDDKNYSLAGEKQSAVSESEKAVATMEAELKETRTILAEIEDMLDVLTERILAIQKNREVLIAGLTVIDVPGAEEIQVLQREKRTRGSSVRNRVSGGGESAFTELYRSINGL